MFRCKPWQAVAKRLAVEFIFTCWYELEGSGLHGNKYPSAEPYIVGEYVKHQRRLDLPRLRSWEGVLSLYLA